MTELGDCLAASSSLVLIFHVYFYEVAKQSLWCTLDILSNPIRVMTLHLTDHWLFWCNKPTKAGQWWCHSNNVQKVRKDHPSIKGTATVAFPVVCNRSVWVRLNSAFSSSLNSGIVTSQWTHQLWLTHCDVIRKKTVDWLQSNQPSIFHDPSTSF